MSLFDDLKDVRKAISKFNEFKDTFDELANTEVHFPDGSVMSAVMAAKKAFADAGEHKATIDLAIEALKDGKLDEAEKAAILKSAQAHGEHLDALLQEVTVLVGAELDTIVKLLSKGA